MGRLSYLPFLLLLPAGTASAAFVETYSASASAGFTLSASFLDGLPGDPLDSLSITFVEDGFDDFPTDASGNAAADGTLGAAIGTTDSSISASAFGGAGGPFGSSVATREGRVVGTFENTSDRAISLAFTYFVDVSATPFTSDSMAEAQASFELQNFFGRVFFEEVSTFDLLQSLDGTTGIEVGSAETVYSIVSAYAVGSTSVFVPAPIPVGASLPLLGTAVAALGLVRRRRGARVRPD